MLKTLKVYYRFCWHYKWRFIIFIGLVVISKILESIQPYFYKLFADSIEFKRHEDILTILIIFISIKLGQIAINNISELAADSVIIPTSRDVRTTVFRKIQNLDFAYHVQKSTGRLISIFKRGEGALWSFHWTLNFDIFGLFINLIVILFVLSRLDYQYAIFILASFTLSAIAGKFMIKKNMNARREFNKEADNISGLITDNLINFETVKLFAKENWEYHRLKKEFKQWVQKIWQYSYTFRGINITVGTISTLGLFAMLFRGLQQVKQNQISNGEFIMILGFLTSFYPKLFHVIYGLRDLTKNQTDLEKYFGILKEKTEVKDLKKAKKIKNIQGKIEFKNISFTYPEGTKAMQDVNLTIQPGQSIALVGTSGAGKTTIAKLIMRFYDPDQGKILLDGIDIKKYRKSDLRSIMGVVPQEPILFNQTIAYNIGYGLKKQNKKQIIAAAKMANLHDLIESLPNQYETIVGERGIKLSGGQKQRLAIARMILSNPEIIIFDEATSQLDSATEKKIQDAFWKAARNKTTVIIAHRLSTITKAEKIIVLEKGKIVEMGPHRRLVRNKTGHYYKFWKLQNKNQ